MSNRHDVPPTAPKGLLLPRRDFLGVAVASGLAAALPGTAPAWAQAGKPPKGTRKGQVTIGLSNFGEKVTIKPPKKFQDMSSLGG